MTQANLAKGDKSPESLEDELRRRGKALDQLEQLQQELANTKGPKRRKPLEEQIERLQQEIKRHAKEIKQKWGDKTCLR